MNIIDTHIHLWKYIPEQYSWITEEMKVLKQDFLYSQYKQQVKSSGGVLVQARQSGEETEFLCGIANQYNDVIAVVGWMDYQEDEPSQMIARIKEQPQYAKLTGFRHLVQDEPDLRFMLQEKFRSYLELLAKENYTYDVLIRSHQMKQFLEYLHTTETNKQPVLVLDHIAKPVIGGPKELFNKWQQDIREIAKHENVNCKISGLLTEASTGSTPIFTPYLEVVLEAFGVDRLVLGSDWPVCTLRGSGTQSLSVSVDFLQANLVQSDLEKILNLNAIRIYGKN
ncbi:MAG: amidohydrolase family protein [Candidatus Dojkabacteria bacterium]|nr:MAG: amidohydrolase family protein [Candidatus Dojkabacteria bacterium]